MNINDVKDPNPIITTSGIVSDLDASRLYPSMILQQNVGFDTFYGRMLAPHMKNTIDFLQKFLGSFKKEPPSGFNTAIMNVAGKYVTKLDPQNKNDETIKVYLILYNLFEKLRRSNIPFDQLINPTDERTYAIFRAYFMQYIELVEATHIEEFECNKYIFDYLINGIDITDEVWIIENQNNPDVKMISLPGNQFKDYLKENRLGITLTGALFKTHENKIGLFSNFLEDMYGLRNEYKDVRDTFPEGSSDYKIYNGKQLAMKVIMNSLYGLTGMASYRYSNKWIAKTITTHGRMCLKTAQYWADKYLENTYGNRIN